mmetsp:Transcript_30738/g.73186  ORF Transcript_30738/g.73186 Transcript_30738/m.73186 type:complete len:100 (+) Transcript_30738:644-943(+)
MKISNFHLHNPLCAHHALPGQVFLEHRGCSCHAGLAQVQVEPSEKKETRNSPQLSIHFHNIACMLHAAEGAIAELQTAADRVAKESSQEEPFQPFHHQE